MTKYQDAEWRYRLLQQQAAKPTGMVSIWLQKMAEMKRTMDEMTIKEAESGVTKKLG